jgi:cyclic pyranopterin phosphate synthase
MVDVSSKEPTLREATARGRVRLGEQAFERLSEGSLSKGDALAVARVAGILAAKRVDTLIPLCHPLPLQSVTVDFELAAEDCAIDIRATVKVKGTTGVEMEALTAVSVAALTIYDMCKSIEKNILIEEIGLEFKSGGKSGTWMRISRGG